MPAPGSSPTSTAPTTAHRYPPRSNSPRTWCSAPSTTPRPWASTPTATSTSQNPISATGNHPAKSDSDSTASPTFSKAPTTTPPASYAPSTGRSDPTTTTSQPSPAPTATCDRPQHTAHPASSSSRSIYITFPGWSTSEALTAGQIAHRFREKLIPILHKYPDDVPLDIIREVRLSSSGHFVDEVVV